MKTVIYARKSRGTIEELNSQIEICKDYCNKNSYEIAEVSDNKEKLSKLNTLYLMNNISQEELTEKSAEIKDRINLLELKQQRLEGYSLFKIAEEIQNKIIKLEELKADADINDLVSQLVDHIQYFRDTAGIQVKTVFSE